MMPQELYEEIKKLLSLHLQQPIGHLHYAPVGGGSINQCYKLTFSNTHTFFCKVNEAARFPHLFLKERQGLQTLAKTQLFKIPNVVLYAMAGRYQVLILEWIESGPTGDVFFKKFGAQLAAQHYHTAENFGFETDNYMGSVPQPNTPNHNWVTFFTGQRLMPLVNKCMDQKLLSEKEHGLFKKLYKALPHIFDAAEKPALLHGDLWSGNFMCTTASEAVLIDPAVYYGHRAVDVALTTLFGGFDKSFYESYHYHYPLPANHKLQWEVCNLYPLLIHLLLFGKSYLTSIQQTLTKFD